MTRKYFTIVAFFFIILTGCKKNDSGVFETKDLKGTWKLTNHYVDGVEHPIVQIEPNQTLDIGANIFVEFEKNSYYGNAGYDVDFMIADTIHNGQSYPEGIVWQENLNFTVQDGKDIVVKPQIGFSTYYYWSNVYGIINNNSSFSIFYISSNYPNSVLRNDYSR